MSEPDEATLKAVDRAIRAHAEDQIDDGEVIVSWLVLAATRRYDGGGVVIHIPSDSVMPFWEARGILEEGAYSINRAAQKEDEGD